MVFCAFKVMASNGPSRDQIAGSGLTMSGITIGVLSNHLYDDGDHDDGHDTDAGIRRADEGRDTP